MIKPDLRGVEGEIKIPEVPMAMDGRTELRVRPQDREANTYAIDPWPFREASFMVRAEGKRLSGRYSPQEDLQCGA